MKPLRIMIIAGEASGDAHAAKLVSALRDELAARPDVCPDQPQPLRTALAPRFFGAGGERMQAAGVELALDLTRHSVIGLSDVLRSYFKFRRLFRQLLRLALERQPDVIIGVDYGGFNLRFGRAIRRHAGSTGSFNNWRPKLVQFVSPQVWASRAGRAFQLQRDYDLLLSIFPFEKSWYAARVPRLRVEFVGHPLLDRTPDITNATEQPPASNLLLLLPGSRQGEVKRHLPVMLAAMKQIKAARPQIEVLIVLPDAGLASLARSVGSPADVQIQIGNLHGALSRTAAAIASTGTVTMECALFGVPTVTLYKTSWSTYQVGKRIVTVKSLTMPNLLAGKTVFPEFIQDAATPANIAGAALDLLGNAERRGSIQHDLANIVNSLGGPGAMQRAARAIVSLLGD